MVNKFVVASLIVLFLAIVFFLLWFFGFVGPRASVLNLPSGTTDKLSQVEISIGTAIHGPQYGNTVLTAELAATPAQQSRGLSYRNSLALDRGMLFVFPSKTVQHFWMQGMKIPLDFVWIDGSTVVDITEGVQSPSSFKETLKIYSPSAPVNKVLEVNAGYVAAHGIQVGDRVLIAVPL